VVAEKNVELNSSQSGYEGSVPRQADVGAGCNPRDTMYSAAAERQNHRYRLGPGAVASTLRNMLQAGSGTASKNELLESTALNSRGCPEEAVETLTRDSRMEKGTILEGEMRPPTMNSGRRRTCGAMNSSLAPTPLVQGWTMASLTLP